MPANSREQAAAAAPAGTPAPDGMPERAGLIPVAEQDHLSLEQLAQAILDRRARPGARQLRRLAEAVLAQGAPADPPAKGKSAKKAAAKDGKARKKKKNAKKAGKGRLAKIPKLKS